MNSGAVLFEKVGRVALVTLNRPQVLNAYDVAMRDSLFEVLTAVRDDPEVGAMVLRGRGAAFCSGGDLREFGTAPSPERARRVRWQRDVWGLLYRMPKATLAAVHGQVVGGGLEMALLCDLCVAAEDAVLAYPETSRGMIPGVGGTQSTPRLIGRGRALEMILTGRSLDAAQALAMGLVARVVPGDNLTFTAMAMAERIAAIDGRLIAATKQAVVGAAEMSLADGLAWEARAAARLGRRGESVA